MYLLIKADHLPVPQGPTWTTWRGQGEKRIPTAQQECCCSQGPTGCKSYTELVGSAKRRGRGPRQKRNSQDGKTHPCHHNVFTVQEDTFQVSAPPSLEHQGVSCLGTGPPLQDADSQNAAVAPVWCRQSLSTDVHATTSQGGSDGLQKPPWTWTCTHKASLPDLCTAASSLPFSVLPQGHR